MDPKYLPKQYGEREHQTPEQVRFPSLHGKFPTILSMYTQQHDLPEDLLQQKGLLGHFVHEKGVTRRGRIHALLA